jgi:hypothetical protein
MLTEFEARLADVLGTRLPAPFTGRVDVPPGPAPNGTIRLVVGVRSAELLEPEFLAHRDVSLSSSASTRRVVRLRCTLGIQANTNLGRADQLRLIEAAIFLLDAPEFRDGSALAGGADPGFRIESLRLVGGAMDFAAAAPPLTASVVAEGWFWPVGTPEQAGKAIREALVRAGFLPLRLEPARPRFVPGGDPVELTLRLAAVGTTRLRRDTPPENVPFGSLAVTLRDAGGRPGAGTLTGGSAGADDVRLLVLTGGSVALSYRPPADPATDILVVAMEDGEGGQGIELGRFRLEVRTP